MADTSTWDRFDKIACIHYLPYMNERFSIIRSELDRIGVLNSGKFFWEFTTPNPIYDYIKIPASKNTHDKGITKATKAYTLQYYSLLKKLQHFGYDHVLINRYAHFFNSHLGIFIHFFVVIIIISRKNSPGI